MRRREHNQRAHKGKGRAQHLLRGTKGCEEHTMPRHRAPREAGMLIFSHTLQIGDGCCPASSLKARPPGCEGRSRPCWARTALCRVGAPCSPQRSSADIALIPLGCQLDGLGPAPGGVGTALVCKAATCCLAGRQQANHQLPIGQLAGLLIARIAIDRP